MWHENLWLIHILETHLKQNLQRKLLIQQIYIEIINSIFQTLLKQNSISHEKRTRMSEEEKSNLLVAFKKTKLVCIISTCDNF